MDISIEQFSPKDSDEAAMLLSMNFGSKFKDLTDLPASDLASLVREEFFESYDEEHERCFISKVEGKVAGILFMEWGERPRRKRFTRERTQRYGIRNSLKFAIGMRVLSVEEKEGNCYFAKLAVGEEFRGKGIAGMLVEKAISFASENGFEKITLYVSFDNTTASNIYKKFGFREIKRIKSLPERMIFGVPGWIYMEKVIGE